MPNNVGVNFNFKYPFLYLFTALAGGIICREFLTLPVEILFITLILALLCARKFWLSADLFLLGSIFMVGLHISSPSVPNYSSDTLYLIKSRCEEVLPHQHYVLSIGQQKVYLNHYFTDTIYQPGDSLTFCARIVPFTYHANPGEFSYARYLKQKKVYCQVLPFTSIIPSGHSHDFYSLFYHFRNKIMQKTSLLTRDSTCQILINALCLGYKTDLDHEFRHLFISTGTVHLLSVSGLHTGALYLFFLFILKHIGLTYRKKELLLLPLLWGYACLTGLAPSVVRASTILSFITVGKVFSRTYIPLNSLAASAFFTLLIQPTAIYSMSFLLSYSAYTGILVFYPFFYHLPGTLSPFLSKIYACCCVTISAQIPTLPLCAFYFHSINLNSFLANLIAVPIATLLLYSSACCLLLPFFVSQYLSSICELLSRSLVRFLQYFAPYSINLQNLYPPAGLILLSYGCLIAIGGYFMIRKRNWLHAATAISCLIFFYLMITNLRLSQKNEIMILHYPKQSAILLNHKGFCLYLENTLDSLHSPIPYVRQHKLKELPFPCGMTDKNLLCHSHQLFHKQDTITILSRKYTDFRSGNILIITDNLLPKHIFNPSRPSPFLPGRIILDGSNNKYTFAQWQLFCQNYQISLENTAENGCIRLVLK